MAEISPYRQINHGVPMAQVTKDSVKAKTRSKRKAHHPQNLVKVSFWDSYREVILFTGFGLLLLSLAYWGSLNRPAKIVSLTTKAQTALTQKDYQTSQKLLEEALMLSPSDPSLHFQLAQLYRVTNNWNLAKDSLIMALTLSPNSTSIQNELTKVQTTLNQPDKIAGELAYWKQEITNKPDYRDGWIQLAIHHYQLYQMEEAKRALEQAENLDPNFETIHKLKEIIN